MSIRLAHHSGRYDKMAITQAFTQLHKSCSVMAHTEFASNPRAKELKSAADARGWGFWQHNIKPYDECCFTWNKATWKLLDHSATVLSDIPWFSGSTGNQMPFFTAVAVYLEKLDDNSRWVFATCHTPSHIAVWDGWRHPSNRLKCYQDGVRQLGRWVVKLDRQWKQHAMVVTADWNAPMERGWFRTYIEGVFPKTWSVLDPNTEGVKYPDTHDNRCIDWAVLGGNVERAGESAAYAVPDSDHKTMIMRLRRKGQK